MTETSRDPTKVPRGRSLLKFRMKVLLAGIVGGGAMIAFPAATALVVTYFAVTLAAIGVMAWAGIIALATAAAAALLVPVVAILAIFGLLAMARWVGRIALPAPVSEGPVQEQRPADSNPNGANPNAIDESPDN